MLSQIEDFVNWLRRRNPSARTWRDYSYDLRKFSRAMANLTTKEINFHDIDRFVSLQVSQGYKPTTGYFLPRSRTCALPVMLRK